jgi:hypothetical protein
VDQEAFSFQPFDVSGAVHEDAGNSGMAGFGGPGTNEKVERFRAGSEVIGLATSSP